MIFLLLTIACTLAFGVLFKVAALHHVDGLGLVTVNYVVASSFVIIGLFSEGAVSLVQFDWTLIALGAVTGLLFIGGFLLFALATRSAGMSLTLSVMRVSVVIPFTYSWLLWGDTPTTYQLVGLGLACASFFLITRRVASTSNSDPATDRSPPMGSRSLATMTLILLFVSGGLADVSMKTFDEVFASSQSRWLFMGLVFSTAALVGLGSSMATGRLTKDVLTPRLLLMGVVLGVVNVGSVEFLLRAIELLSGTFVFPAINISVVVGAAIIGVVVWKEHLSTTNRVGIGVAVLALFLMQA